MSSDSFFQRSMSSSSSFDENQWVIQIRQVLEEELEDYTDTPVSIFNVPQTLMASDPNSYIPQQVALGPYHFRRSELYEMHRYKVIAAKIIEKQLQYCPKFEQVVNQLTELAPKIRECYHKFLDFQNETLVWMVAIDASFLLEFLQNYAVREGEVLRRISSRMSNLFDVAGRKSTHNAILRDLVMLENQIPFLVVLKMLEFQLSPIDQSAEQVLLMRLIELCKDLSPFRVNWHELSRVKVTKRTHLLDFLYHVIVPESEVQSSEIIDHDQDQNEAVVLKEAEEKPLENSIYIKQLLHEIWKLVSRIKGGLVRLLKRVLCSKATKFILKLPWKIIANLPGLRVLAGHAMILFFFQSEEEIKPENNPSTLNDTIAKAPLVEEITIPSVSELSKAGVHFVPTNGTISTIHFDIKTAKLFLPTITLNVNTEVILRNLVAYEACNAPGPVVIARYTELMNGIIDTEEDLKLLAKRRIVLNRLKNDKEAVDMWNGMNKSVKLTKVPDLDKVIKDVNKFYNGRWKVKVEKFMKVYVFGSWQFLTFLAAILLFLLMSLQSFCSVYDCANIARLRNFQ